MLTKLQIDDLTIKNYTIEDIKEAFLDGFYEDADDLYYKEWDFEKNEVKPDTLGAEKWQEYLDNTVTK